jgi:hypothetical protein
MNTLSAMSDSTEVLSQKRPVELRGAPGEASFAAVEAGVQPAEDAQKVPILFSLVRKAVLLLLAIFVVTYIIVAFCVEEAKALWPRGRMSHPK